MNFIFVFGYMNMIIFSYQQQSNDDFKSLHHYGDLNGICDASILHICRLKMF